MHISLHLDKDDIIYQLQSAFKISKTQFTSNMKLELYVQTILNLNSSNFDIS